MKSHDRDVSALDATTDEATEDEATFDEMYVLSGDCDNDGKVSVKDATCIQKYLAGISKVGFSTRRRLSIADVDESESVNIKDATAIQKHCAGMDCSGAVGENKKLDGKVRIFYDTDGKLGTLVYCYSYGVGNNYSNFDDLFERGKGKEVPFNEELGLYVIEVPEYADFFVLSCENNYTTSFSVPLEQDMMYCCKEPAADGFTLPAFKIFYSHTNFSELE